MTDRILEILQQHPSVESCDVINEVYYIVLRHSSLCDGVFLNGAIEDWELRDYLRGEMKLAHLSLDAIPKLRIVDFLPEAKEIELPFNFVHILDTLFRSAGTSGNEVISFEEFVVFCKRTKLFNSNEDEIREVFFDTCSRPSTPEILFRSTCDLFQIDDVKNVDINVLKFYEFQKLIFDAGLVEAVSDKKNRGPLVSYFIDERLVDIVLENWFAAYDLNGNDCLCMEDYVRLVNDYRLPFSVSKAAFYRLTEKSLLDRKAFRSLLEQSEVLQSGSSVERSDEVGKIWRRISGEQKFFQPKNVFVADGRQGVAPQRQRDSLRFVCISDTHGRHRELTSRLPEGDVLLHAGDFSMSGELDEITDFASWMQSLPFQRKVVIAGNHDLTFDRTYTGNHGKNKSDTDASAVREAFASICNSTNSVVYLEDEEYCFHGVRIYGTPWQPEFGFWAFNLPRGQELARKWKAVPPGIDILMVHGPPLGRGDIVFPSHKHIGCADLLAEIQTQIRPAYVVCGHVHEGAGVTYDGTTHFLNASSLDEHYDRIHPPLVFDIPMKNGNTAGRR